MKRISLLLCIALLTFASVKAQTPLQFNNSMAAISDSLFAQGKKWGTAFTDGYRTGNYSAIKPIADSLDIYLDTETARLQKMKDIKNSKPLRLAMLDYLGFEKQMLAGQFRPFEAFDSNTPKEKIQAAANALIAKSKDEEEFIRKVNEKQIAYAKENGFEIAPKQ